MSLPNNVLPVEPVIYSTDPTDQRAPALALSQVPRLVLPALSPSDGKPSVAGDASPSLDVEAIRQAAVAEYKADQEAKTKERMAKAREARTLK